MTDLVDLQGRDLDAAVAEKVMGWCVVQAGEEEWLEKAEENGATYPIWHWWPEGGTGLYRTDDLNHEVWSPAYCIAAAWEVLEKIRIDRDRIVKVEASRDGSYTCAIGTRYRTNWMEGVRAMAETAPLAICRAALRCVGKETIE